MKTVKWDYEGRVAIVTAATAGIGKAIALRLVESGAKVIAAARTASLLEEMAATCNGALHGVVADVCNEDDIKRLVREAVARFGRLDCGFNVAGGALPGTVQTLSSADWDHVHAYTLRSVFLSMKYQSAQMIAQGGGGAIVNVSSINSMVPLPAAIAYSTMKAGVDMVTRTAAVELAPHGIRVNALLPGLCETPATAPLLANEQVNASYLGRIPMARAAHADEMTGPALFLGSGEASYVTGSTLVADGGWTQTGYPDISGVLK